MSLPGINFCLKDSELWGKWCWVDSKQSSGLKHFQEKDLWVAFCFCHGGRCVVLCPPVLTWSSCGCAGCMWGAWSMQAAGAGLSGVGYLAAGCLSGVNSLCQSVRQAGRQAEGPPWQRTPCKSVLSQFSPQTHHPEKPLFPTTGSPREHYS